MTRRYFPKLPAYWFGGEWQCACPKCVAKPPAVKAVLVTVHEAP